MLSIDKDEMGISSKNSETNAAIAFTPEGEYLSLLTSPYPNETGEDIVRIFRQSMPEYRYFPVKFENGIATFLDCPGRPFCYDRQCKHTTLSMN